jgi:rubrerythrin
MKAQTQMGLNRTGIQMSPFDFSEMESGVTSMTPATPGDDSALAEVRSAYIEEADALGSVPIPGTVKGVITTTVSMLTGNRPELFLDKLGERLAFERTGTRLYDALITKFDTLDDGTTSMTVGDLQQIREDEARHFSILADAIDTLGADPTAQTPCADVSGVESMGLMQVMTDPRTTLAQSLHAILVAEMTDQNGWEMLIVLAEEHNQNAMVSDFTVALNEERTHLQRIQMWFEEATLGSPISAAAGDADQGVNPSQLH